MNLWATLPLVDQSLLYEAVILEAIAWHAATKEKYHHYGLEATKEHHNCQGKRSVLNLAFREAYGGVEHHYTRKKGKDHHARLEYGASHYEPHLEPFLNNLPIRERIENQ